MGNRLKEVREELADKQKRLDEIESLCTKESRGWTTDELSEVVNIEKDIDNLVEERSILEKQAKRKAEKAKEELSKEDIELDSGEEGERGENKDVKVTNKHLKTKEARDAKVFMMIQGKMHENPDMIADARKSLIDGGHYDDILKDKEKRGGFETLTDGKGGILVPSSISADIIDISQEYGVIPRLALNLGNIIQGDIKVPQVLGRPTFYAVNQGSAIQGSGFNLGGISLKALKWGTIIDWTNEVDESVGAKLMPIIMAKVGEAYAYVQDNTFFNGDGTSTYNGIDGLEGLVGTVNYVRLASAVSGNTSFATLDAEDFLTPQENVTPGARSGSVYVMHPNMIFTLRKLKDGQGKFIYGDPSEVAPAGTLWGYPIELSEAHPYTDGVSKTVCSFFNPKYVAYATGRNLTATKLTEGSITDEDSNTVNLATMDAQAIRMTGLFDLKLATITRSTAGTAQGAFSVLRTAAS